jgi:hypothetical protein
MKASVQSICRPILRAFFALLALWAIPGGGATRLYATRLYVTEFNNSTRVGAYDATGIQKNGNLYFCKLFSYSWDPSCRQ